MNKQEKQELKRRIDDYASTLWESDIQDFYQYINTLSLEDRLEYVTVKENELQQELKYKKTQQPVNYLWVHKWFKNRKAWTVSSFTPTQTHKPAYFYEWCHKRKNYRLKFISDSNSTKNQMLFDNIKSLVKFAYYKLTIQLPAFD